MSCMLQLLHPYQDYYMIALRSIFLLLNEQTDIKTLILQVTSSCSAWESCWARDHWMCGTRSGQWEWGWTCDTGGICKSQAPQVPDPLCTGHMWPWRLPRPDSCSLWKSTHQDIFNCELEEPCVPVGLSLFSIKACWDIWQFGQGIIWSFKVPEMKPKLSISFFSI